MSTLLSRAAIAAVALVSSVAAQVVDNPYERRDYSLDSGYRDGVGAAERVVFRGTVAAPGASWLRLRFARTNLDRGSRLRLTSVADRAVQLFDARSLRDYEDWSAYFNGDAVVVELLAAPNSRRNRVRVVELWLGQPLPIPQTICGPTDDRKPSQDVRAGRQYPTGCTSWLINATTVLTAGHCTSNPSQQVHFNVPLSTSSGRLVLPPPKDQYRYDTSTLRRLASGVGSDWAVCAVLRNSTTGLYPGQAQGAWYELGTVPGSTAGQNIRITGYGTTDSRVPRQWNQAQKTHVGPLAQIASTYLRYQTDTTGGNSGSPVIHENTGKAIGIHTHGGCTSSGGGANYGTRIDRSDLQAAIRAIKDLKRAGSYEPFGQGCKGTAGVPALSGVGFPDLGKALEVRIDNVPAQQPGVLYFGASDSKWGSFSLPLKLDSYGMPGCSQLVSVEIAIGVSTGASGASFKFTVPNSRALIGAAFYNQYAVRDRAANALGIVMSNGAKGVVGD